ncbi:hypothetical protein [Nocardia beijingensis]
MDGPHEASLTAEIFDLLRANINGDPAAMLSEYALDLGQRLWAAVGAGTRDIDAESVLALGGLHFGRYTSLPIDSDTNDLETALHFFTRIHHADPTALPSRIVALIDVQQAGKDNPVQWIMHAAHILEHVRDNDEPIQLDLAIDLLRRARPVLPRDHPAYMMTQADLSAALGIRYRRTHRTADLTDAIVLARTVVSSTSREESTALDLSNLAILLAARFERTKDRSDLKEALEVSSAAVERGDTADSHHTMFLSNHCSLLLKLYDHDSDVDSLNRAVDFGRRGVKALHASRYRSSQAFGNLAAALGARHQRFGMRADLDDAIALLRQMLEHTGQEHPDSPTAVGNLIYALVRGHENGDDRTLDEAMRLSRELFDDIPLGHPARPHAAVNVGLALLTGQSSITDLDEVIEFHRHEIEQLPSQHLAYPMLAANLAQALKHRFDAGASTVDLDEAITTAQAALDRTAIEDRQGAHRAAVLADVLERRASAQHHSRDLERALEAWTYGAHSVVAPVFERLRSAVRAGQWATRALHDPARALAFYADAIALLDRLAWRGLDRATREQVLTRWPGLAAEATAMALECGDAGVAVRLSEQGRAVLWSQLTATRDASTTVGGAAARALTARLIEISEVLHRA